MAKKPPERQISNLRSVVHTLLTVHQPVPTACFCVVLVRRHGIKLFAAALEVIKFGSKQQPPAGAIINQPQFPTVHPPARRQFNTRNP